MLKYILRRILFSIPVLIGASFIAFLVIALAPGDFLDQQRMNPTISKEKIDQLEKEYGLDKNVFIRYGLWIRNVLQGNWGYSFSYKMPVWNILGGRLEATLLLSITTFIFSWGIGIPLGIYSALHQYTVSDQFLTVFGFIGISIPTFFFSLLWLFMSAKTHWFPVGGMISNSFDSMPWWKQIGDYFWHVIGPMVTLGFSSLASTMRIMRGQLLDEMNKEYVQFVEAKGMPRKTKIYKHALRNAINPIVTALGYTLAGLLGGSLITENVFGWPGMGSLMLQALNMQDQFLVMANLMLSAFLLIIGNLIADILLAAVDPRVRFRLS